MSDERLRDLERRFKEVGTWENFSRYMAELDRTGIHYVQEVDAGEREGRWFETPIVDVEFGLSSKESLNWPDAWRYAKGQGGVLQSLGEAVIRRFVLYKDNQVRGADLDHNDKYQVTRTVNLKFFDKGNYLSAFAELPDEEGSLELLAQGFEENSADRELLRPYDNPLIAGLLEQARSSRRVRPVQKENRIGLKTQQNGSSEYGGNSNIIAVFGEQLAPELNAFYLQQRDHQTGSLWDITEDGVKDVLKGKKGSHVLVRPVGLGGGDGIVNVVADSHGDYGRASPVAHKRKKFIKRII